MIVAVETSGLATAALSEAESMGMRPTVERAQAVLDALGPPKRPAYPAGLSEREVEVLRLVASHVQSIFNKTGCPNRVAATRLGQSGLDRKD